MAQHPERKVELLESLSFYNFEANWSADKIQTKFHSPIQGQSGDFFGVPGADAVTEFLPHWDNNDLPANL